MSTMYYIKPNKATYQPQRMLFLDSETTAHQEGREEKLTMKIATTAFIDTKSKHSWDNPIWNTYTSSEELVQYIESKCYNGRKLYVFAHNIYFDIQACSLFKHLAATGWYYTFMHDSAHTYILSVRKDKKTICFLSTTNFYSMTLEKLGIELGIPKLKIDFNTASREDLLLYCKQDVAIIIKAMETYMTFLRQHNCGKFCLTRASQAFSAFRHAHMKTKICVHQDKEAKELERNAYMGARNECWEIGKIKGNDFVSLDVNSMYPSVMVDNFYPTKLKGYGKNPSPKDFKMLMYLYFCIAHVRVHTSEPCYAVRGTNKLYFPTGSFDCYLTMPDLVYARKQGHILKVYEIAIYNQAKIFTSYVNYYSKLKEDSKKSGNAIDLANTKIFLNSLYGKFGQRNEGRKITDNGNPDLFSQEVIVDAVTKEVRVIKNMLGKRIADTGKQDASHTFTVIAATVSAYARKKLWETIKHIGGGRVLYCDTDSIILRREHIPAKGLEIDNYKMGAWKIDGEYQSLEITACKHYKTDNKYVIAGIPADAIKTGKNTYTYWQWSGQGTHLTEGCNTGFIRRKVTKTIKTKYDKGRIQKNGRVLPWKLPRLWKKIYQRLPSSTQVK